MQYGLLSLILVQLVIAGGCLAIYLRQKSQMDVEKHDRVQWGIKITGAVGTADSAKHAVETIEVTHFKALRALFEAQGLELAECRKEITSLRNEVMQLRTKHASDARQVRREAKEIPQAGTTAAPADERRDTGETTLEELIRNGHAMPFPVPGAPPAATRTRPFGAIP